MATRQAAKKKSSSAKKSGSRKRTSAKKSSTKKSSRPKYSPATGKSVETEMKAMKKGQLKTGRSGKKVTSRKQAIAIGLSKARKAQESPGKAIVTYFR